MRIRWVALVAALVWSCSVSSEPIHLKSLLGIEGVEVIVEIENSTDQIPTSKDLLTRIAKIRFEANGVPLATDAHTNTLVFGIEIQVSLGKEGGEVFTHITSTGAQTVILPSNLRRSAVTWLTWRLAGRGSLDNEFIRTTVLDHIDAFAEDYHAANSARHLSLVDCLKHRSRGSPFVEHICIEERQELEETLAKAKEE